MMFRMVTEWPVRRETAAMSDGGKQPRGLRNNNPGNIRIGRTRYLGEIVPSSDREFRQFSSMAWGYRAIFVLLDSYSRRGIDTIRGIVSRYAPSNENDTSGYARFVCRLSGLGEDEPLDMGDRNTMVPVVAAISKMENGVAADIDEVLAGWELFESHRP